MSINQSIFLAIRFVIIMFLANLILMDPSWAQRLYVSALSDIVKVSIVQNASVLADKAYSPNYIGVKIGQQVLFINNDVNEHTVTFGVPGQPYFGEEFGMGLSKVLDTGDKFEHSFNAAGNYTYYCQIHTKMIGKIMVK